MNIAPAPNGSLSTRRALLAVIGASAVVAGCGFQLRQAPNFSFDRILIGTAPGAAGSRSLQRRKRHR